MKHLFFLLILISTFGYNLFAQEDAQLSRLLSDKTSLDGVMQTVKNYYKTPETLRRLGKDAVDRSLRHWGRYEWYMSSRLGPNGEFVNISQKMVEATGLQQNRQLVAQRSGTNIPASATGTWSLVGPYDTENGIGRIDRLAFHPTDANTVYAGAAGGGLWRTTNAGTSWTNLTPDIPSLGISGIVIDPVNTNTIYILTGDGDSNLGGGGLVEGYGYMRKSIGVLKSTNAGGNWTRLGDFPGVDYSTLLGYRLIMHPTDNNIIYACTNQGLFMSLNAGISWGVSNSFGRFFNMKFRPGSGNICYAVGRSPGMSRSYFWRSTTSGITWDTIQAVNNMLNNPTSRVELAVAASNSNIVYLLAGGVPGTGQFKGLLRSDDIGLSFDLQSNTPNILGGKTDGTDSTGQSTYDLTVATSNTTSATVVVGAVQAWRSLNSGVDWVFRGALHDDVHELAYHPVDNKLWAATDGGVYSSIDNGATWTSHFDGMSITQFYRMAVSPANYQNMIAGAQDNAVKRKVGITTYFDQVAGADGFAVGYDFANPDIMYAVTNRSISRSTNGGNTFSSITPNNANNPFSMGMAVHTSLGNAIFIGSDSIWRTTNGGINWAVSPNILGGWFLRTCPSNGSRVYAAGGGAYNSASGILRRSDDGGATWPFANILSSDAGFPNTFPKITSINVDPTNSLRVWITFGGYTEGTKVYYADYNTNPSGNWVNMSGTLPNLPVNCIAIDNNNNAYVGTDNGIYYRGAGMSDWVPFYNNLPYVPVTELIISESDNRIRAATFGRGIWGSDLYSTCPADLNITGTLEGQEFYTASNSVTSTASLLTSDGSKVQMRGGNEVLLQDGFTARESTQFRAAIGPCGSGGVAGFRFAEVDSSTKIDPRNQLSPSTGKQASVYIKAVTSGQLQFNFNQKIDGEIDIHLTDESGKTMNSKNILASRAGNHVENLRLSDLRAGTYYLHVLLDKRFEHMQEVIIQ